MEKIIVTFTSYPETIRTVSQILDSIINQTILPDKIILYLSSSEFLDFKDIPDLKKYAQYGFEIHWHEENLKSHKKWFYAFQEYPNDIIITIDDSVLYQETALESLLEYHKIFPTSVIGRNGYLITCNTDGTIAPYENWYGWCGGYVGISRMDLFAIGNGGILYPPHIFRPEIFRKDIFMEECQYADDIWMKIMEVYSGVSVVLAEKSWDDPIIEEHIRLDTCSKCNRDGDREKQLRALLKLYTHAYDKKESITDRIFAQGRIFCSQIWEMEKREVEKVLNEFITELNSYDEILVYGAGMVGNAVYYELTKHNSTVEIKAFVVNSVINNPDFIEGIPVKNYREFINGHEKLVIALHDKNEAEKVRLEVIKEGMNEDRILLLNHLEIEALFKTRMYNEIFNSGEYWEKRYSEGGDSGSGSYNRLAYFKAKIINEFVEENKINKVIEWGCGDGNQLKLARYPMYIGFDVSLKAIELCKKYFEYDDTKKFIWCGGDEFSNDTKGDLAISLDVIYHLIEDNVYEKYMENLFSSSIKYVCIYSSNFDQQVAMHVKHRKFTDWVGDNLKGQWQLLRIVKNQYPYIGENPDNTSVSDFYFFENIKEH